MWGEVEPNILRSNICRDIVCNKTRPALDAALSGVAQPRLQVCKQHDVRLSCDDVRRRRRKAGLGVTRPETSTLASTGLLETK